MTNHIFLIEFRKEYFMKMYGIIEWKIEAQIHFATTTTFPLQLIHMGCFVVFSSPQM